MLVYLFFFLIIKYQSLEGLTVPTDCSSQNIYFQPRNQLRFYKHPIMNFLQHNSNQLSLKNFSNYIYEGKAWYGLSENNFFLIKGIIIANNSSTYIYYDGNNLYKVCERTSQRDLAPMEKYKWSSLHYFYYLQKSIINPTSFLLGELKEPTENKNFPIIIKLLNQKDNTVLFLNCINGQIYEDASLTKATNYSCGPSFLLQRFIAGGGRMTQNTEHKKTSKRILIKLIEYTMYLFGKKDFIN